jgi:hypothetical protein
MRRNNMQNLEIDKKTRNCKKCEWNGYECLDQSNFKSDGDDECTNYIHADFEVDMSKLKEENNAN